MAKASVSKTSKSKAVSLAEITAAEKSGATWAEMFIREYRKDPASYALEGWVDDAESLFKGNQDERLAFYDTLQRAMLHEEMQGLRAVDIDPIAHLVEQAEAIACFVSTSDAADGATGTVAVAIRNLCSEADSMLRKAEASNA